MNADTATLGSDRFETLERRQRRTTRWLALLGAVVLLQAGAIAYLAVPFGGSAKHPLTLQAGRFEVIDGNGTVRAKLTAEYGQTLLSLSDTTGTTRILLRENEIGFATMEFSNRHSGDKTVTLFTGTKRSFLELRDPRTRQHLNAQAGEGEMGLTRFDERGQALP